MVNVCCSNIANNGMKHHSHIHEFVSVQLIMWIYQININKQITSPLTLINTCLKVYHWCMVVQAI